MGTNSNVCSYREKTCAGEGGAICPPPLSWIGLRIDKGDSFGALLIDLSKAFDWLSHELLITKLAAYGFSRSALKLMWTSQKTKISIFYSS